MAFFAEINNLNVLAVDTNMDTKKCSTCNHEHKESEGSCSCGCKVVKE